MHPRLVGAVSGTPLTWQGMHHLYRLAPWLTFPAAWRTGVCSVVLTISDTLAVLKVDDVNVYAVMVHKVTHILNALIRSIDILVWG